MSTASLDCPSPKNYYMSLGNGVEVWKKVIVNSLDFNSLETSWLVLNRNIEFLCKISGILPGFTTAERSTFIQKERFSGREDIDIMANGDIVEGNSSGLGCGKEWILDDVRHP